MSKRKTAKAETPPLPVLYVAERTAHHLVSQPDKITVKRFKAVTRGDEYYTFNQPFSMGDVTSRIRSVRAVDSLLKSGGREFSCGAAAATPDAALELLMRSVRESMDYLESQVEGRRKTIEAIRARIDRETAKSKMTS